MAAFAPDPAPRAIAEAARRIFGLDVDPSNPDARGQLTAALLGADDIARVEAFVAELTSAGINLLEPVEGEAASLPPAEYKVLKVPAGMLDATDDDVPSTSVASLAAKAAERHLGAGREADLVPEAAERSKAGALSLVARRSIEPHPGVAGHAPSNLDEAKTLRGASRARPDKLVGKHIGEFVVTEVALDAAAVPLASFLGPVARILGKRSERLREGSTAEGGFWVKVEPRNRLRAAARQAGSRAKRRGPG